MLSPDLQYLVPKRFFEYGPLNKTDVAKQAGINRKTQNPDSDCLALFAKDNEESESLFSQVKTV